MNNERPTPETDEIAESVDQSNFEDSWRDDFEEFAWVSADFARKLERERDEAITTIEDAKRALKANDYEGILLTAMRVKEERNEFLVALREAWFAMDELVDAPDRIINWQNKYAHTLEETK